VVSFMPWSLYFQVTALDTHQIGGPRAGPDTVTNRNNPITDPIRVGYNYLK